MSADALQVRRARLAIYGPPTTAIAGALLAAIGILGFALTHDETTTPPSFDAAAPPASIGAPAATAAATYLLVAADGHVYSSTSPDHAVAAPKGARAPIVGAAAAAGGGLWIATADGHVLPDREIRCRAFDVDECRTARDAEAVGTVHSVDPQQGQHDG